MSQMHPEPAQACRNVMESLVLEEAEKQLKRLPAKMASYLGKAEVAAYALNRLPPLYATSQKGWQQQRSRAFKEFSSRIVAAVRQAIAAVQQDPIRTVAPLRPDETWEAQVALNELKDLLRQEELSWENLVEVVEHTLVRTARGEVTWRKRGSGTDTYVWKDAHYL